MILNKWEDDKYAIADLEITNILKQKYCVFDLEATGLDFKNEYIIQIGAIIVENKKINYAEIFKSFVNPQKRIPGAIERLTSITNNDVNNAPPFIDIYDSFKEFIGDSILVSQCGFEFDFNLLKEECKRNRLPYFENEAIDTKVLFGALHRELNIVYSTDFLAEHYKIYNNDVKRHDALGDSILIGRILIEILAEYESKGINSLNLTDELIIRRFIPSPLNRMSSG